jgi:hypothetical protein
MQITRVTNSQFVIVSGNKTYRVNHYRSVGQMRWTCSCPVHGECKHLRAVRGCGGLGIGDSIELDAPTRPVTEHIETETENGDYEDQHMIDDVGPEIEAARRGRAAYRRFLGY